MHADEIPATLNGLAEFNVANALGRDRRRPGPGREPDAIAKALRAFTSSHAENPGRFNVHDAHGFPRHRRLRPQSRGHARHGRTRRPASPDRFG
jgi:hypothetical protein